MRKSRDAKAETRKQIVTHAARLFREKGIEQTSVSDVMQSADLTHGGFYRHFQSKEELVSAAVKDAVDGVVQQFQEATKTASSTEVLNDYIETYLSEDHVTNPGLGCPVAGLGVDIGRIGGQASAVTADGIAEIIHTIGQLYPNDPEAGRTRAAELLARLVGAVVIARATNGAPIGTFVLDACLRSISAAANDLHNLPDPIRDR